MRIVSLLPSATEILCALGAGGSLVGRSSECDYPPVVRSLPAVMRPKVDDFHRPSSEIDRRVRDARSRSESLYYLDLELLRALRPDLLVTQDLCSVCSVTEAEAAEACQLAGIRPAVVSLSPRTLSEVWGSVRTLGDRTGRGPQGRQLEADLKMAEGRADRGPAAKRPSVAIVEWVDPPILAGLWVSEMVAAAGGRSLGPGPGRVGARTSWQEIAREAPDLVVISPCSFSVERTRAELSAVPTIQEGRLPAPSLGWWLADEAFFSRPGPRLAQGIALIRALANRSPPEVQMPFERWELPEALA